MGMIDEASLKRAVDVLTPAFLSVGTNNGVGVDRSGANAVCFALHIGIGGITFTGANRIDFSMQDSPDGTTWTNCLEKDMIGSLSPVVNGIFKSLQVSKPAADVSVVGYRGGKKFSRVVTTFVGSHGTSTMIGVSAILEELDVAPVPA